MWMAIQQGAWEVVGGVRIERMTVVGSGANVNKSYIIDCSQLFRGGVLNMFMFSMQFKLHFKRVTASRSNSYLACEK